MTPSAAERLLAMLDDRQAIESLSADEVRDDLVLLGLDPAPAIAFAKALAAGHDTPGGRLLGGIGAAEDVEEEIARIESAGIDQVRAAMPAGTAAAIAAEARRKAGTDSNIVGMQRRRRSRMWVWGAPTAGIAASLLVVIVGYEVLTVNYDSAPRQRVQRAASPPAGESEAPTAARSPESSAAQPEPAPMFGMAVPEGVETEGEAIAKQTRRDAVTPPSEAAFDSEAREALADDMAPANAGAADEGYYRLVPESPERRLEKKTDEDSTESAGQASSDSGRSTVGLPTAPPSAYQDELAGSAAVEAGPMPRVVAVLVVDERLAPESIQSQSLPPGRLADRLEDARQAAAGREVLALITLEGPDGPIDFVQVPLTSSLTQQLPPPSPIARLLGADAGAYDFIALPAR